METPTPEPQAESPSEFAFRCICSTCAHCTISLHGEAPRVCAFCQNGRHFNDLGGIPRVADRVCESCDATFRASHRSTICPACFAGLTGDAA